MKFSILNRLAIRSIFAKKRIYFPYLLAITLLFSLEYILISLLQNDYVNTFHADLNDIIGMGVFFSTLLIFIITLYMSNFIQKNQIKEIGLYSVLGLEKKHIRFILFVQNIFSGLIVSLFSVVIGYLTGSLMFIALNRLMQDTGASLMNYPFQFATLITVTGLIFLALMVSFAIQSFKMMRLNPIDILREEHKGESEPKGRIWLTIIGLASLILGYYIALTTNDVLGSLINIFIAIFLVIVGTYALFLSLSIQILNGMKKNENIYYKPNNFLSISGMLQRMNNNAVSLASIAILSSGVILVLGITLTLYRVMETQIDSAMPTEYSVSLASVENYENNFLDNEAELTSIANDLSNYGNVEDIIIQTNVFTMGYYDEESLIPLPARGTEEADDLNSDGQAIYIIAETIETFNQLFNVEKSIENDEILITSNLLNTEKLSNLTIGDRSYETLSVTEDAIPSNYGVELIYLAFSTPEQLEEFRLSFQMLDPTQGTYSSPAYNSELFFNVLGDEGAIQERLNTLQTTEALQVEHIEEVRNQMYHLYGGLLFIGIIVSLVLIIGTIIMLYFKQITEGYSDRKNYQIMKQVGLPESMIKKTINSQIIWVFGLPIFVAILHNLFASKIMYTLIGLFGNRDLSIFVTSYFGVLIFFVIAYLIFYKITSKTYYNIINE